VLLTTSSCANAVTIEKGLRSEDSTTSSMVPEMEVVEMQFARESMGLPVLDG
jgi:hypothetical protein